MIMSAPFLVKNCYLSAVATGEKAGSLFELRERIALTEPACIYFHFWGGRLHTFFTHPEYHNDFAAWASHQLHDPILAERLAIIDPTDYESLEELRAVLLEILDDRLEEIEMVPWTKKEDRFSFIRSKIIIFDTPLVINKPDEILFIISEMAPGAIFFHFIDARGRTDQGIDDLSTWLSSFGEEYQPLIERLESIDPYYLNLSELRHEIYTAAKKFFERTL